MDTCKLDSARTLYRTSVLASMVLHQTENLKCLYHRRKASESPKSGAGLAHQVAHAGNTQHAQVTHATPEVPRIYIIFEQSRWKICWRTKMLNLVSVHVIDPVAFHQWVRAAVSAVLLCMIRPSASFRQIRIISELLRPILARGPQTQS